MTYYVALIQQSDEGCDYTIACGRDWLLFDVNSNANSTEDAVSDVLKQIIMEDYEPCGERRLSRVKLIEISKTWDIPIEDWYEAEEDRLNKLALQTIDRLEFEQYEKLKKKFGDK